ncbi:hypothetical protein ANCCEY_13922 [Ancylostoma ceylanicum]|uniref:Uncharacterized protein n=1 Tax=Ancylostoma ceylanicum TaxID=53326 RepID=A0A0D6LH58_9BILA|nr:hypothetical protein ANCCEY_13922 [Ancylostoma ceylanicum]
MYVHFGNKQQPKRKLKMWTMCTAVTDKRGCDLRAMATDSRYSARRQYRSVAFGTWKVGGARMSMERPKLEQTLGETLTFELSDKRGCDLRAMATDSRYSARRQYRSVAFGTWKVGGARMSMERPKLEQTGLRKVS